MCYFNEFAFCDMDVCKPPFCIILLNLPSVPYIDEAAVFRACRQVADHRWQLGILNPLALPFAMFHFFLIFRHGKSYCKKIGSVAQDICSMKCLENKIKDSKPPNLICGSSGTYDPSFMIFSSYYSLFEIFVDSTDSNWSLSIESSTWF